ncbi:MAG: shikimate kinase [Elusimicrobiota bacterium]
MKNIYLLGLMGSGKTTIGRVLAKKLRMPFADTDLLVKNIYGLPAGDFIKTRGLKAFRDAENSVFKTVVGSGGRVIALGGGIIPTSVRGPKLKKSGVTIYLKCAQAALYARLIKNIARRPLLGGSPEQAKRALARLLKKRRPYYEQADLKLDTSGLTPEAAAVKICKLLGNHETYLR